MAKASQKRDIQKRTNIMIDDERKKYAKKISGEGNLSAGIRMALDSHKKAKS
ncbi:MAG: hypothetical protein KAR42_15625 [candidate division Zixibacteria bacterium]|nr:hypothetical protein [candidate division Zixibacteria bacterium]